MIQRPYQLEADAAIDDQLERSNATLAVLATGLGKTVIFAHAIKKRLQHGRVMVVAHREELIKQAAEKIEAVTGIEPDIEMASSYANEGGVFKKSPIVVSTVQTQCSGYGGAGRMCRFSPEDFSMLVIDEAHHSTASQYRRVINYYRQNPKLKVLGVTATPDRHDEEALGQIFETVAFEFGILEGINQGWLVPIEQQFVTVDGLDFSHVRTTLGDLNQTELEEILKREKVIQGMTGATVNIAGNRKTLVFAASVALAELMTEIFNRYTPGMAAIIHGKTDKDERASIVKRYRSGDLRYLVNVGVATEGFDVPDVEVISVCRPTKSRALYCQMIGRGTRPLTGLVDRHEETDHRKAAILQSAKPNVLVIDFTGNSGRHKLVTTADILGGNYSDAIQEAALRAAKRKGGPVNIIDEMKKAEQAERLRRQWEEAERRRHVTAKVQFSSRNVDPFNVFDLQAVREPGYYKGQMATESQKKYLENAGIPDVGKLTKWEASRLAGEVTARRQQGKCTYKQAKLIAQFGYSKDSTFAEATAIITALKANGWRRPVGVAV